jgi:hypothetical protein
MVDIRTILGFACGSVEARDVLVRGSPGKGAESMHAGRLCVCGSKDDVCPAVTSVWCVYVARHY